MHSLNHQISFEKGFLRLKNFRDPEGVLSRNHYTFFVLLCVLIAYSIYEIVEENEVYNVFRIILYLAWLVPIFKDIYRWLFVLTWKSKIKVENIKQIESKPEANGVETRVILNLKNGRRKEIVFRNAEPYLDAFLTQLNLPVSTA